MFGLICKALPIIIVIVLLITLIFIILSLVRNPVEQYIEEHNKLAWTSYFSLITIFIAVVLAFIVEKTLE